MNENDDDFSGKAKGGHARRDALSPEERKDIARKAAKARWEAEPLRLQEDLDTGDQFVLYTKPDGQDFQLRFEGAEPWANQSQIADLFGIDRSVATKHIRNIFKEGEVDEETSCAKLAHEGQTGQIFKTKIYNLDMILAVGYRVQSSKQAIIFRRWATDILKQYLIEGFVIDVPRLEDPDGRPDHFEELLKKIRHIRSSEKRMWTRILDLASFCSDYGMMTDGERDKFFATVQNAMYWSVTQMTAAEVIYERVDSSKPKAGLTSIKRELPTVAEASVGKNYYGKSEIETLNLVTSMTLEFFESQAEQRRPTTIEQFLEKMRELLKLDGRPVIRKDNRGSVSMAQAKKKASQEIKAYKERVRIEREIAGEKALKKLGATIKGRSKKRS